METAQLVSYLGGFGTTEIQCFSATRGNAAVPALGIGQGYEWPVFRLKRFGACPQPFFNLLIEVCWSQNQVPGWVELSRSAGDSCVRPWSAGSANFQD